MTPPSVSGAARRRSFSYSAASKRDCNCSRMLRSSFPADLSDTEDPGREDEPDELLVAPLSCVFLPLNSNIWDDEDSGKRIGCM